MSRLLRKVAYGLRTQGLKYLYQAPLNEFAHPRLAATRAVRRAVVAVHDLLPRRGAVGGPWAEDALLFVYDLAVSPVTFDFMSYLAAAELTRRRMGRAYLDVVFVMGRDGGLRQEQPDYAAAIDETARLWRLRNILQPALALLPSVRSSALCTSRRQASLLATQAGGAIYPPNYRVDLPCQPLKSVLHELAREGDKVWPMLRATPGARRHVKAYLDKVAGDRRPIVFSLRNYGFSRQRNSRIGDWVAFADRCDKSRYAPIFVQDTEVAITTEPADLGGHAVCLAASWNLEVRMALYEAAWLNMGTMHGPLELCWLNEAARYIIFLPAGTDVVNSVDALTEHGHRIGSDLDFAGPNQHIVWSTDELDNIERAFAELAPGVPDRAPAA